MNSGSETAVDSIVGLNWTMPVRTAGVRTPRWKTAQPELCEKPANCERFGRGKPAFNIDDAQNGGGFNSLATMGVNTAARKVRCR